MHSFIHSTCLMWARLRGPREESPPEVPSLVGEARIDTMNLAGVALSVLQL